MRAHSPTTTFGSATWLRALLVVLLVALFVPAVAMGYEGDATAVLDPVTVQETPAAPAAEAPALDPLDVPQAAADSSITTPAPEPLVLPDPPAAAPVVEPVPAEPPAAVLPPAPESPAPSPPAAAPPAAIEPSPPVAPPSAVSPTPAPAAETPFVPRPTLITPLPLPLAVLPALPLAPPVAVTPTSAPELIELIPAASAAPSSTLDAGFRTSLVANPPGPNDLPGARSGDALAPPSYGLLPSSGPAAALGIPNAPPGTTLGRPQAPGVPSLTTTGSDPSSPLFPATSAITAFVTGLLPSAAVSSLPDRGARTSGPRSATGAGGADDQVSAAFSLDTRVVAPAGSPAAGSSLLAVLASYVLPGGGAPSSTLVLFIVLGLVLGVSYAACPTLSERLASSGLLGASVGHRLAVCRPG